MIPSPDNSPTDEREADQPLESLLSCDPIVFFVDWLVQAQASKTSPCPAGGFGWPAIIARPNRDALGLGGSLAFKRGSIAWRNREHL
jgi:hypothetical protein